MKKKQVLRGQLTRRRQRPLRKIAAEGPIHVLQLIRKGDRAVEYPLALEKILNLRDATQIARLQEGAIGARFQRDEEDVHASEIAADLTRLLNDRPVFREVGQRIIGDVKAGGLPDEKHAQKGRDSERAHREPVLRHAEQPDDPSRQTCRVDLIDGGGPYFRAETIKQHRHKEHRDHAVGEHREGARDGEVLDQPDVARKIARKTETSGDHRQQ